MRELAKRANGLTFGARSVSTDVHVVIVADLLVDDDVTLDDLAGDAIKEEGK